MIKKKNKIYKKTLRTTVLVWITKGTKVVRDSAPGLSRDKACVQHRYLGRSGQNIGGGMGGCGVLEASGGETDQPS